MLSAVDLRRLTVDNTRDILGPPEAAASAKKHPVLGLTARRFIAHSPFVVLATSSPDGADCSPRGDAPGFVRVLSPDLLALPDRAGNNLADSFSNLDHDRRIGMLFLVPGVIETLRVNGSGFVTDDPRVLRRFEEGARPVRLALLVEVDEVFIHCGKALIRSSLWAPDLALGEALTQRANVFALDTVERANPSHSAAEIDQLLAGGYQMDL